VAIQRHSNGGLRKNAGDLTPELARRIVAAVRKTPLSKASAARAVGMHQAELRYIITRGSLPGADPLWADTSVRCRELIAAAEAKNYRRLEKAAAGGVVQERVFRPDPDLPDAEPKLVEIRERVVPANVSAQTEIQRQIEKDTWRVEPGPEDAPIVYMDLFSRPLEMPPEILQALLDNGWVHPSLHPAAPSPPALAASPVPPAPPVEIADSDPLASDSLDTLDTPE
jgi:hypothetical protein